MAPTNSPYTKGVKLTNTAKPGRLVTALTWTEIVCVAILVGYLTRNPLGIFVGLIIATALFDAIARMMQGMMNRFKT